MALQGNLKDFSTAQLLNLVNLARKTGAMHIEATNIDIVDMYFREGKLIHASTKRWGGRLADMLLHAGKISKEQAEVVTRKAQSDKAVGIEFIRGGVVNQQDIIQSVKGFMMDVVYSLAAWSDGYFKFDQGASPPKDRITVPLNLDNVILEVSRQREDKQRLLEELPDLDVVALKVTDKPLSGVKLTPDDWRVISHIHPRNTVAQIAQANSMDEFQIRQIVDGMLQAGLVELVKPEGLETQKTFQTHAEKKRTERETPAMKRSVVERLITRIKRI